VGEQKSGNVLRLYTGDGETEYILEGSRALGTTSYTGKDILEMAFAPADEASWVAVAGTRTGASELIVSDQGDVSLITKINSGLFSTILGVLGNALLYAVILLAAYGVVFGVYHAVTRSRMIVVKLIVVSIPVLILALTLFGVYSYSTYWSSLRSTYETKASDQGNLLRALFSSASFDKITAPGLYGSVEYNYLRAQMGTRDVYTSSAYFVDGKLYTGVDSELPALYSFDVRHSADARALYRAAAMSGTQQSGVITDRLGERIICVTPVGSSSGNTVFLLETGIFQAEIDRQTGGFLRNYLIISICCLISACALLLIAFLRILRPLGDIIEGLDQFSQGNRTVRLENATNDELSDIARVFNKMAKDIDVQIYNLKMMGDTYYRFVPQQVFRLLGKENLADVELGNAVEGKYCVLVANLYPRQGRMDFDGMREITNNFFAIIHKASGEHGATLLSDSAGLRDLRLICPDGDAAVGAAMEAIARIDEYNAKCPISQRLDVSFFLHYTPMGFGICGDGERYVPALISAELDDTLARCEPFRRLSSRLIVTGAAYEVLDAGKYFHRFIGYASDDEEQQNGLYDFYDSGSPTAIRLLNDTLSAFNKAMILYLQKRYYDAKNMFAVVLRENQYDNVTRHYIFQCEKKL
jgi:HAMP domain-containing protein